MSAPVCRCCGSSRITLRGRKPGEFIRSEFSFYACEDCELLFVEPFSGFAIYNDAYYRGQGPDPYVDYETEYRDWRSSDRGLEFEDLAMAADAHAKKGARGREQGAGGTSRPAGILQGHVSSVPASCSPPPAPAGAASPPPPLRWLDFGCGAGGFLKFLRERGSIGGRPLELTGHDVGSYADLLERVDGFRILNLEALRTEPSASFDVISMIEVIEHLPDPADAIATIARLLRPGGLLLLTTGNLDCAIARRHGIHYRYCAPEIHVSLFNPRCLTRLYRRFGLEPKSVRYHGAVKFKVVKSLRHRPVLRFLARAALAFPPVVRAIDAAYGVSAMPCATKTS